MKRVGAVVMTAAVAASMLALALSAGTHEISAVALRQPDAAESEIARSRQREPFGRRQSPTRTTSRDQDQMLLLLLFLEGSSPSRR